jgi:hypothetical protein
VPNAPYFVQHVIAQLGPSQRIGYDGRIKSNVNSVWFSYAVAAAAAMAIAVGLWLFGVRRGV